MQENLAAGRHLRSLVDEEYRLASIAAQVDFIDRLIARITDPTTGWAIPWAAQSERPPA